MILTGNEIHAAWRAGKITIDPLDPESLNPNSYNFRLGRILRVYRNAVLDPKVQQDAEEIEIPDSGYVLEARRLYLASTQEVMGSDHFVPTFAARSSVARLGLFINLSASLGDIGFCGEWTLQLFATHNLRVYPGMKIGQIMWWQPLGEIQLYAGKYQNSIGPCMSRIHHDFAKV